MMPTIQQAIDDNLSPIHFWNTSIDVLIPHNSTLSYKGQGRHLTFSKTHLQGIELDSCPRCDGVWKHSSEGKVRCMTRGCYTFKEYTTAYAAMNYHDAWKPFEEFVATEEGAKLYKKAMSDTKLNRAAANVNIPPSDGTTMNETRGIKVSNELDSPRDTTKTR